MDNPKKQSFVTGAAVLTASTVIIKVFGALFKLPLANILGNESMADFAAAYNIYALLLTVSTAGLPVALSRMISTADAVGRSNQVRRTFRVARGAFFVMGGLTTLIMLFFSKQLAAFEGAPSAELSVKVLAPALVCVCLTSAYRGYTQGLGNMVPTSLSQIIETLSKIVFGLTAAWFIMRRSGDGSVGAAGGIFGVSFGTLLALLYIIPAKLRMDRRLTAPLGDPDVPESVGTTLRKLIAIGVPITIGSCVLNVVAVIDMKMIMERLQNALLYDYAAAKGLYGTYFNTQTLYNLPSAFAVPMVTSAIPAIAAYVARKEHQDATQVLCAALKLMNLLAMPMAVGMGVLSAPIMGALYGETGPVAGRILAILSAASYGVCIMMVTNAILQAYGHEWRSMLHVAIAAVCKVVVNYILLGVPSLGILGAAIGNVACYGTVCVLNLLAIRKKAPECPPLLKLFGRPLLSSLIMGVCAWAVYRAADVLLRNAGLFQGGRMADIVPMVPAIVIAVLVYLLMVVLLKAVTRDELELVPKGDKIAKLLRIK